MFTNLPPVTKGLLIINCAVFVLQLLLGPALDPFMLWPWLPPEAAGQGLPNFMPWQLLTHGFMHSTGNPAHLLFNMLALLMFGAQLEYVWGQRRFLTYYLVCVLGAGLCQLAVVSWKLVLGVTGTQSGVAHFAHLGGMLFGWLLIRHWRGQPPFGGRHVRRVV